MAYYKAGKAMDLRDSHNALIIPPLAVILVSCFIFVLVQPNTPLPTLEPTVLIDQTSTESDARSTMSPQPATATTSSLQAANTNNQKTNLRINVPSLNKR